MQPSATRSETLLWLAQRMSAVVLALCMAVHLVTMIIAMQGGVTTAEIAGRLGGQPGWLTFYGVFVAAVSIHAPIGIRTILLEMTSLTSRRADLLAFILGAFIAVLGFRAIIGLHGLEVAS